MTFEEAKRTYVHRYTMEHIPAWARQKCDNGKFYAPQFRTDREWFDATLFPPNNPFDKRDCHTSGQTWPLGQWLDKPFARLH